MKLTIIIGGSIDFYHNYMNLFKLVEKKEGWAFRRINFERFVARVKNVDIDVRFCWNPTRDKAYEKLKRSAEDKMKFIVHDPADELVKKIGKTDAVLFFGSCGAFLGKKGEVYVPQIFNELLFKKLIIDKALLKKLKPKGKISFNNHLRGKMVGKDCRVIISNLTLSPDNMKDKNKDLLIEVAKKLSDYGDVVEKESYQIVKGFKDKCPLGVVMVVSDVLSVKKHMMDQKHFKPNKNNLARVFIQSVKAMLGEIK